MKIIIALLLITLCFEIDLHWKKIDELEERIEKLERILKNK